MRVLFIAPLAPPITGQSVASETLLERLREDNEVSVVNLSVESSNDGSISVRRILEVLKVLRQVWRRRKAADVVYLTISESVAGNVKDLMIYLLCAGRLSQVFIHLHGGSIKKLLFDPLPPIRWLNALFVRRLGGVIISGRSHEAIFAGMIDHRRIHVIPNFAPESLFVSEASISAKFRGAKPLRILYISGMSKEKGYEDLAEAFLGMAGGVRERVRIDFAGRFDSVAEERSFRQRIAGIDGIQYHGLVDAATKEALFAQAHVFCLPTAMHEGQPISILEAFASGCVVVTTGQPGIRDVFSAGINGFEIEPKSPQSIATVIEGLVGDVRALERIATTNRHTAGTSYKTATYNAALVEVLQSVHANE